MENELRDKEEVKAAEEQAAKSNKKATKKTASAGNGKQKRQSWIIQILNGEILTKDFVVNNLTFIFFIFFLLLLMVSKGYYGKQLQKDINTAQAEVDGKTAEYIEKKAKLEEVTARYRLVRALKAQGVKESVNPVKVIRVKKQEDE